MLTLVNRSLFLLPIEIELCKVEKRYRLNPDPPEVPLETEQMIESVLPIPQEHPDVLLHTPDFEPKVGFLRTIGLDVMPPNRRDGKYRRDKMFPFVFCRVSIVIIYIVY